MKAVRNFFTDSKISYLNSIEFHRVIPSFMLQTGSPDSDGTVGETIWGALFEYETFSNLNHDIGTVSMANAGPNPNESVARFSWEVMSMPKRMGRFIDLTCPWIFENWLRYEYDVAVTAYKFKLTNKNLKHWNKIEILTIEISRKSALISTVHLKLWPNWRNDHTQAMMMTSMISI